MFWSDQTNEAVSVVNPLATEATTQGVDSLLDFINNGVKPSEEASEETSEENYPQFSRPSTAPTTSTTTTSMPEATATEETTLATTTELATEATTEPVETTTEQDTTTPEVTTEVEETTTEEITEATTETTTEAVPTEKPVVVVPQSMVMNDENDAVIVIASTMTTTTTTSTIPPEPTTAEQEPATTEPVPTTTEPEPTTTEPEPATTEPVPTTTEPEPTTIESEPTTIEPEPTTIEPEPTTMEPKPTTIEPEPTTMEPEPTTIEPEPTNIEPESTTTEQVQPTTEPAPTTSEPEPTTTEPDSTPPVPEPTTTEPEPTTTEPGSTPPVPEPTTTEAETPETTEQSTTAQQTTEVPPTTTVAAETTTEEENTATTTVEAETTTREAETTATTDGETETTTVAETMTPESSDDSTNPANNDDNSNDDNNETGSGDNDNDNEEDEDDEEQSSENPEENNVDDLILDDDTDDSSEDADIQEDAQSSNDEASNMNQESVVGIIKDESLSIEPVDQQNANVVSEEQISNSANAESVIDSNEEAVEVEPSFTDEEVDNENINTSEGQGDTAPDFPTDAVAPIPSCDIPEHSLMPPHTHDEEKQDADEIVTANEEVPEESVVQSIEHDVVENIEEPSLVEAVEESNDKNTEEMEPTQDEITDSDDQNSASDANGEESEGTGENTNQEQQDGEVNTPENGNAVVENNEDVDVPADAFEEESQNDPDVTDQITIPVSGSVVIDEQKENEASASDDNDNEPSNVEETPEIEQTNAIEEESATDNKKDEKESAGESVNENEATVQEPTKEVAIETANTATVDETEETAQEASNEATNENNAEELGEEVAGEETSAAAAQNQNEVEENSDPANVASTANVNPDDAANFDEQPVEETNNAQEFQEPVASDNTAEPLPVFAKVDSAETVSKLEAADHQSKDETPVQDAAEIEQVPELEVAESQVVEIHQNPQIGVNGQFQIEPQEIPSGVNEATKKLEKLSRRNDEDIQELNGLQDLSSKEEIDSQDDDFPVANILDGIYKLVQSYITQKPPTTENEPETTSTPFVASPLPINVHNAPRDQFWIQPAPKEPLKADPFVQLKAPNLVQLSPDLKTSTDPPRSRPPSKIITLSPFNSPALKVREPPKDLESAGPLPLSAPVENSDTHRAFFVSNGEGEVQNFRSFKTFSAPLPEIIRSRSRLRQKRSAAPREVQEFDPIKSIRDHDADFMSFVNGLPIPMKEAVLGTRSRTGKSLDEDDNSEENINDVGESNEDISDNPVPTTVEEVSVSPVNCSWEIETDPELYLLVTFHNLSAPFTVDCEGAFIQVEREWNGFEARWCGSRLLQVKFAELLKIAQNAQFSSTFQGGSRPHVVFAKQHLGIGVFDDGTLGKAYPTGFSAEIEGNIFF